VGGVIRLQDLDSEQIYPADSTDAEGVGDKFTSVLSRSTSGWSAYRWTTSTTEDPDTTDDGTDCDGAYKVSYFEKASENVHRFVGGGMCLDSGNSNTDVRVENLRDTVNGFLNEISTGGGQAIPDDAADNVARAHIETAYTAHESANSNTEMGEYYLFVSELQFTGVEDQTIMGTVQQVTVMLDEPAVTVLHHPDTELVGENTYRLTDDSGRAFIKEVVDELRSLETESSDGVNDNDQALIDEGVWNVYTFPKFGDPDTLSDPPKLSYFRIVNNVGNNNLRFIVGAGIYLDVNNLNAGTSNKLEPIRNKVGEAAALLIEGENEEGELPEMFFEADEASTEEFQEVIGGIAPTDDEAYIFVWENR